ncbi:MAG: peroxidase family protein [Nitrospirota bacterium]
MRGRSALVFFVITLATGGCATIDPRELVDCVTYGLEGFRPVAAQRTERFLGKVDKDTARCRGGNKAVAGRDFPWVDWQNYWAAGDAGSKSWGSADGSGHFPPNGRGIDGALLDLEFQRMELIRFNLFDNSGTYEDYVKGRTEDGKPQDGPTLKVWQEMRLPRGHPQYEVVGGDDHQTCRGELIRFRTLTGICNDIRNPLMGSTGQPFARNVEFETTFPDLGKNDIVKNRHADRLELLKPDPQMISRTLFIRTQSQPHTCHAGLGLPGNSPEATCDYKKAPFFNVLAAFWIQFMTHDWFSHLEEGHNREVNGKPDLMPVGCMAEAAGKLGCRPDDRMDRASIAEQNDPPTFTHQGKTYLTRAYKTTRNTVTAWWDASQIYGYDERSHQRVKRDPKDPAKLQMITVGRRAGEGEKQGYLPQFDSTDPINPAWADQEATAFPDNWSVGLSFFHNVFAREHNQFVEAFRDRQQKTPNADSGLRHPARPDEEIPYKNVSDEELFQIARLVVSAEIAKIHTIEWTTQLLYDEPLYLGMNANWHGLLRGEGPVSRALEKIVVQSFGKSRDAKTANQWYSVFAAGPGIFGLGSRVYADDAIFSLYDPKKTDIWSLKNPDHVNGGTNHFGSPFNFPEEFITVYRLHPMVPDLLEYRELKNPNGIVEKIPVVETFRGKATPAMRDRGLANWALSMGRQRLGLLALQNHPQFLQNLPMPASRTGTGKLDVAALDLIRDRERGVPRFNEFRRQYGLKTLMSFDDFVDQRPPKESEARKEQEKLAQLLREVYGRHTCDASKIITTAQVNDDGTPINDCLGHPDGSMVDNVEDVDTVVGWLAEPVRPHGFAISETQFQVFILNASRRLFSDRFFTSSFRPEFYTHLGVEWVTNNGPDGKKMEPNKSNGHEVEVSPLKRVLQRTIPELKPELEHVINVFDPWARDRGEYYSLQWKPRPGAEADEAFR